MVGRDEDVIFSDNFWQIGERLSKNFAFGRASIMDAPKSSKILFDNILTYERVNKTNSILFLQEIDAKTTTSFELYSTYKNP